MNRTVPAVLVPAAVGLGVAAEWTVLYRGPLEEAVTAQAIRLAVADFVVGLALVVCGVAAWLWRSGSRIGPLLVASGFAWFLGTFAGSSIDTAAQVGGIFVTLHRGPLVHAVLSYPTGRLRGRVERLVAAISYVAGAGCGGLRGCRALGGACRCERRESRWSGWRSEPRGVVGVPGRHRDGRGRIPGRAAAWRL